MLSIATVARAAAQALAAFMARAAGQIPIFKIPMETRVDITNRLVRAVNSRNKVDTRAIQSS